MKETWVPMVKKNVVLNLHFSIGVFWGPRVGGISKKPLKMVTQGGLKNVKQLGPFRVVKFEPHLTHDLLMYKAIPWKSKAIKTIVHNLG